MNYGFLSTRTTVSLNMDIYLNLQETETDFEAGMETCSKVYIFL